MSKKNKESEVGIYGEDFYIIAKPKNMDPVNGMLDQNMLTVEHTVKKFMGSLRKDVLYSAEYMGEAYSVKLTNDALIITRL